MVLTGIEDVAVDYNKSVKAVYAHWARRHIERTKTLNVLSFCVDPKRLGLPSWVPDLRR